ncbi:unnamed protein product [Sphagnum troendelagicum]
MSTWQNSRANNIPYKSLASAWSFSEKAVVVSANQAVDTITMQSEEPAAFTAISPASRGQPQATSAQGGHASLATAAAPPPQGYDYGSGPYGPDLWGELKPEWELCKTGISQSPLAITPNIMITDPTLGELDIFYTPNAVNATISNTGHAIEVDVGPEVGILKIYNVTYRPKQFHFHMPSEHQILEYRFPLELHLLHKSEDGLQTAVIAILFQHGPQNPFLAQVCMYLPVYTKYEETVNLCPIIFFGDMLRLGHTYGRYQGSLTTPPCTEKVIWTIMLWNWPTVSSHQLQGLRAVLPGKGRTLEIL